ncbi:hypothetical protein [Clostridium saccharobutylicum]|uniref:hypothetical protein n=1 Tax=Clostridium saccharobutylicum TaxID=169679 RepID=UPI001A9B3C3D|nr:hypothetical protein [Clostridium saccharobutylicum]
MQYSIKLSCNYEYYIKLVDVRRHFSFYSIKLLILDVKKDEFGKPIIEREGKVVVK